MMDINLYLEFDSWYKDSPDATIKGKIIEKNQKYIHIVDKDGFEQMLMLDNFFAITFKKQEDYLGWS